MTVAQSTLAAPYFVGIDVHKESVSIAAFRGYTSEPELETRLPNDLVKVRRVVRKLLEQGPVRVCYEASGCGYVLHRSLSALGAHCDVIAPSLIPKRPGDRRKTDRRDARELGRLYRSGHLTPVHVPTRAQESLRDLVRCREVLRGEVHRSKQYVLKLLQRHDLRAPGCGNWTKAFWVWLRGLAIVGFTGEGLSIYVALLSTKLDHLRALDQRLEEIWQEDEWLRGVVGRLRCLRGIDTLSAMVLATEIVDIRRFGTARHLMGWLGLTVSEESSGEVRRYGGITKAGNGRCRRILVEAAWHSRHRPAVSKGLRDRRAGQPPELIAHADRAQRRLHRRYKYLELRKDKRTTATAVARELAGFVWAVMHDDALYWNEQPRA